MGFGGGKSKDNSAQNQQQQQQMFASMQKSQQDFQMQIQKQNDDFMAQQLALAEENKADMAGNRKPSGAYFGQGGSVLSTATGPRQRFLQAAA